MKLHHTQVGLHCVITLHSFILTEQVYDSLFLLFSRCSYLQLFSSDLHNSLFLTSRLPAEYVFFLLYFCLASFLLICHAVFLHAVTHDTSICAFNTILCLKSFYLLGPCVQNFLTCFLVLSIDFLHPSPDPYYKDFQSTSISLRQRPRLCSI